ncbi:helix-turn-helix domain-containing protein [Salinilacihabitans rarus]|uniref:helix-turn-helix domain-containing protein n=1 Tax=Salinilacihabitans rarus TaxID=2961596 RepID=UPI0020C8D886|nr:helix-turn-helix domain-containing protein [Salinilacihabitans rarus]
MSATATDHIDVSMPEDIRSARAKLVYFCLAVRGTATADELCDTLDVDKSSVLSITGTLRERGHVRRANGRYELD